MAATDRSPDNPNYLSPLGFRFVLTRTPKTNYYVQNVTLPSATLSTVEIPNPLLTVPYPGDKLQYDPLTLTFMVDEDMTNYLEMYDWLTGLGFPENSDQRKRLMANSPTFEKGFAGIMSDGTLYALTSHQNVNVKVMFKDMFPVSLSDLNFDSTLTDVEYLRATVSFRYTSYTIEKM